MKIQRYATWMAVGSILLVGASWARAQGGGSLVYRMDGTLTGYLRIGPDTNAAVTKLSGKARMLVNIARDRSPLSFGYAEEVLAMVFPCGTNVGSVIVYNTTTKSNLVTIATFRTREAVASGRTKGHAVVEGEIQDTHGATYTLRDGFLVIPGSLSVKPTNDCQLISFKGSGLVGAAHGVGNDQEFEMLITKGALKTLNLLDWLP